MGNSKPPGMNWPTQSMRWPTKKRGRSKTKTSKFQPSNTTQMKKIININFHGRVIPIEETAYEILQQYIESLRVYFAREEGRDEIINDIENRFAELFSESLKKGATCIADPDVNAIIASMGRPEDFEQEELAGATEPGPGKSSGTQSGNAGAGTGAGAGSGQQSYSSQQG